MKEAIPRFQKRRIDFNGGLNEYAAVADLPLSEAIEMENFRLTKDGRRVEKRLGLSEEKTDFGEDVYGYGTYYDSDSAYVELAILETEIQRLVGAGSWTKIHEFSSSISHPINIVSVQGKQFIINEVDSRMIHTDKADYQIGITAPTTIPTVAENYVSTSVNIDEDFNDLTAWTDNSNNGSATATQSQPGVEGPSGDDWYLYLTDDGSPASGEHATLDYTTVSAFPPVFDLEFDLYIQKYGYQERDSALYITIYTGFSAVKLIHHGPYLGFWDGYQWNWHHHRNYDGAWATFKYHIDASEPNAVSWSMYKNGVLLPESDKSDVEFALADSTAAAVQIKAATEAEVDYYIDDFKIIGGSTTSTGETGNLNGQYRYAITYARSGNFGCESNPIYSLVGATSYTQGDSANNDDLTVGGTYEGTVNRNIRVQITAEAATDKMKWSDDGGESWHSENVLLTTNVMYLSYGITLTFASKTGHEVGDIWDFTCSALSVACLDQRVNFSSIPVSGDAQVDQRKIYRTLSNGARFYWLATISDNTTTTFEDNIPDSALGSRMQEDRDVMPNGKLSAWWDNRLWVFDVDNDICYYSQIDVPEEFDTDVRYITFRQQHIDDEITGAIPYKDALYVFKRNAIYIILKQPGGTYGRYLINSGYGCIAPWSLKEVNNSLMFLSYRGWEVYNGYESIPVRLSLPLDRTFSVIDTTKYDLITSVHLKERSEIWLSLPDRTGGASAVTCVYNYMVGRFYVFSFYKTPSCLVEARNSSQALVVKMGTRDGYLDLCESGYQDGSTNITATIRKPWIEADKYANVKHLETEFEIPASKTLTMNIYVNFQKTLKRTDALAPTATLTSTDIELRRPIRDITELGQRAKYFCVEYTNAENLGGDLRINKAYIYYAPTIMKGKISGD